MATLKAGRARAQTPGDDEFAAALRRDMTQWKVPGASYALLRDGQITGHALGLRREGSTAVVTPETMFQAASQSKTVAAVTALVLVQREKLALDTDINTYLTTWKLPIPAVAEGRTVTLRRLLGMTGGINVHGFAGYQPPARLPSLVHILDGLPPANSQPVRITEPPGAKRIYSGGGYQIVQAAIENVSREKFAPLTRATVLQPAGMTWSGFDQPIPSERSTNIAVGHLLDGNSMVGGGNVYPELAAAGLWSTPTELAKFLLALCEAKRGAPGALLTPALVGEMLTPVDGLGYGLGGIVRGEGRERIFTKRGHNTGFHSYMLVFPETGQGGVLMTNSENGRPVIEAFFRRAAEREGWPAVGELGE